MTPYELMLLAAEPLLPPLRAQVRARLRKLVPAGGDLLDVGGRKSPYTVGIPANVTVSDLPRASQLQERLNLGLTPALREQLLANRSNVVDVIFDDMTQSSLPSACFDCVLSVEVIEHVEDDEAFVRQIARVLRPGGAFLLTTPNGDYVVNNNPDHHRHYRRDQLLSLLSKHFAHVEVEYAVAMSPSRMAGMYGYTLKRPVRTMRSLLGNVINHFESWGVGKQASGTEHLIAAAHL